jgi:flagellar secretion chaperone FliS
MNALVGIKAYAKVEVESGVSSADPHKLIAMLYQGAILAIANGRNGILRKDTPAKGAAISKAIIIIDEGLNACLDKKVGGELARNLSSLYEYMVMRLLAANLNNDLTILDEVARLLGELQGAWEGIRPGAQTAKSPEIIPAPRPDKVENNNTTTPQSSIGKKASLMYGRM